MRHSICAAAGSSHSRCSLSCSLCTSRYGRGAFCDTLALRALLGCVTASAAALGLTQIQSASSSRRASRCVGAAAPYRSDGRFVGLGHHIGCCIVFPFIARTTGTTGTGDAFRLAVACRGAGLASITAKLVVKATGIRTFPLLKFAYLQIVQRERGCEHSRC